MVPFKTDEVSRTIFPLKLYEYLGAGLPVVSTNFNPDILEKTKDVVFLADTPELFADAIVQALQSNTEKNIQKRLEIARNNTWEQRIEEFSDIIESLHK